MGSLAWNFIVYLLVCLGIFLFKRDFLMPPVVPGLILSNLQELALSDKESPKETSPRKRSPSREVFEASVNRTHDQLRLAYMSMGPSTPREVQVALELLEQDWRVLKSDLDKDCKASQTQENELVVIEDKTMRKIDEFIHQLQAFQLKRKAELQKKPLVGSPRDPEIGKQERSEVALLEALQSMEALSRSK